MANPLNKITPSESFLTTERNNNIVDSRYKNISIEEKEQLLRSIKLVELDIINVKSLWSEQALQKVLKELKNKLKHSYYKNVLTLVNDGNIIYSMVEVELTNEEVLDPSLVMISMKESGKKAQDILESNHNRNATRLNPNNLPYSGGRIC